VVEHALATGAVDAQLLGALGDGLVVLLQLVLGVAGGDEAADAAGRAAYWMTLPTPMAASTSRNIGSDR
jgi:hypothetical protein